MDTKGILHKAKDVHEQAQEIGLVPKAAVHLVTVGNK